MVILLLDMNDKGFPWPPDYAPKNDDVETAWDVLHGKVRPYMMKLAPNKRIRTFLEGTRAHNLFVKIQREEDYRGDINLRNVTLDARPFFYDEEVQKTPENDAESDESDDDSDDSEGDDDQGNLGVIGEEGEERFAAETDFVIAMSYEDRTVKDTDKGLRDIHFQEVSVSPDQALYLIMSIRNNKIRKAIADALIFKFIKNESMDEMAEEEIDGGVEPAWRGSEPDPAADALIVCTKLRVLYEEILEGLPFDDE